MQTVAFCECEPYCRAVLKKHWPEVPCYDDVRELTADRLARDGITDIDVICGGFPCVDISVAGRSGAGLTGERSGLWREFARLVGEIRPRYAIIENVPNLLSGSDVVDTAEGSHVVTWMGRILGDLASMRYDAEWYSLRASDIGAPHRRDRIWITAYPERSDLRDESGWRDGESRSDPSEPANDGTQESLAHANRPRLEGWLRRGLQECSGERTAGSGGASELAGAWLAEPEVGRVAYGVPARTHRLRALGNAVVPQIPEIIGRAIMRATDGAELEDEHEGISILSSNAP